MNKRILSFILLLALVLTAGCTPQPDKETTAEIKLYPASQPVNGETLWGYIDDTGKFAVPPAWQFAEPFNTSGVAIVTRKDLMGLINAQGEVVLEPKYASLAPYSEGLAVATVDYKEYDVLDPAGKVLFTRTGITGYYKEGLVGVQNPDGLFGYADATGKDVIAPQYTEAGEFVQGKALVKTPDGAYRLIDPKGAVLKAFDYESMWSAGEGLYVHGIPNEEGFLRYGYVDATGAVILEAAMDDVGEFHKGLAVAGQWGGDGPLRGLVNTQGEFVVPMAYGALLYLGEDLYAAVTQSFLDSDQAASFQKAALMDGSGKLLTSEKFYNLSWFDAGTLSASDGTDTFLIDRSGALAAPGFRVPGVGVLTKQGSLIRAAVDNDIRYYTTDGKLLWQQERIAVYPKVTVKTQAKRFDRFTLVEYPVVSGLGNPAAAEKINGALTDQFLKPYASQMPDAENPTDTSVSFKERILGNLLEIQSDGYQYPLGAAHGSSWTDTTYFDLDTGDRYLLQDLFYPDHGFDVRLSQSIKELIPQGDLADVADPEMVEPVSGDHPFRLQEGGLEIYYQVYELAPYAAGQPSFTIPWIKLEDILDKDGPFWQAYKAQ